MKAPRVDPIVPGTTMDRRIGAKASRNPSSGLIKINPAPMMIKGEGIGIITDSMMTPGGRY